METYLKRNDTKILKGLAIIMMLMHHLWAFPDRLPDGGFSYGLEIFGMDIVQYLGGFAKLCVSFYMFLGGYGMYINYKAGKFNVIAKIKQLYFSYWKVFLIFVPIGFLFFANQPIYCDNVNICNVFSNFSWLIVIQNFFGLSSSLNGEWWFLIYYVYALILFTLVIKVIDRNSTVKNVVWLLIFSILSYNVFPALGNLEWLGYPNGNFVYNMLFRQAPPFITVFLCGVIFAKHGLFEKIIDGMKKAKINNVFFYICGIVAVIMLRNTYIGDVLDFVFMPAFIIFFIEILRKIRILNRGLAFLGKHSTNMWFIHSFFCYYFYKLVIIVMAPRDPVLSLALFIAMTLAASVILDLFWKGLGFGYGKIKDGVARLFKRKASEELQ